MLAIAATVGGVANIVLNWDDIVAQGGGLSSVGQAAKYFAVGAVVGTGGLYLGAALAPVYGTGAIAGAVVGLPTGFATGFGNSVIKTGRVDQDTFKAGAIGGVFGFVSGGLVAGTIAGIQGKNFFTGVAPGGASPSYNWKDANWKPWKHPNPPRPTYKSRAKIEIGEPEMSINDNIKGLDYAKQGKHVPSSYRAAGQKHMGTQYIEGRSILEASPETILNDLHSGNYTFYKYVGRGPVVEMNYNVGVVIDKTTNEILGTTRFIKIHSNPSGLVHFVPFLPN